MMLGRPFVPYIFALLALGAQTFAQSPAIDVNLTVTGTNVDTSEYADLGFGLDPAALDGIGGDDTTDVMDVAAVPPPPPAPQDGVPDAYLVFDNPDVTISGMLRDIRYFDGEALPEPESQVWKLDVDFGDPADPITISWDSTIFQSGGAAFDAGYVKAEIRESGVLVADLSAQSQIVLTASPSGLRSLDFVLARENVLPTAFDDRGVVVFRNEATPTLVVDVLVNDSDADGDAIEIASVSGTTAKGGTVSTDGSSVLYTPPIQTSFEVTAATKNATHPQFGNGDLEGYVVDGIQGWELSLQRDVAYTFSVINTTGHPFYIADNALGNGTGALSAGQGVNGNFVTSGSLSFTPNGTTPSVVYYASGNDSFMGGRINIVDSPGEATGLISDPNDETTWDSFSYTIQETAAPANQDSATVELIVLPGNIVATRSHAAVAAVTGENKGLEVTVTVSYSPGLGSRLTSLELIEVLPATDDALGVYTIPDSAEPDAIGGLAVFGDVETVVQDDQKVTFQFPAAVSSDGPLTFTYRIVGPDCDAQPDSDCDTRTKSFDFGEVQFELDGVSQSAVPMAATEFNPLEFPIEIDPNEGLETSETDLLARAIASFDVSLRSQPTDAVVISVTSSDTEEGVILTPGNATLTFNPGNWNIIQTVQVAGVDDDFADGDQAYQVILLATSDDATFSGAMGQVHLTNLDDDQPGVTATVVDGSASEAGDTAVVTLVLDSQPEENVTILLISANDSELEIIDPVDGELDFTDGDWDQAQTVIVRGVDELIDDDDQSVNITISLDTTDPEYSQLAIDPVAITNVDNDQAGVNVDVSEITTSERGGQATVLLDLNSQPLANVAVQVTISNGEAVANSATFTFTDTDWDQQKALIVTGVDDLVDDGVQTYDIDLDWSYSSKTGTTTVSGTNLDNEVVGILVEPSGLILTTEDGSDALIDIALSAPPTSTVVLDLSLSDSSEGSMSTGSLTFTTGNWHESQEIAITPKTDSTADGDVLYHLVIEADPAVGEYDGDITRRVPILNQDIDDARTLSVQASPLALDFGEVLENESLTFHVSLNNAESSTVTYSVTLNGGAPFEADVSSIALSPSSEAAIAVTYAPTAAGSDADVLVLDSGTGDVIRIPLVGEAVSTLADTVVSVAPGTSVVSPSDGNASVSFDLEINATAALSELSFVLSTPAAPFTISSAESEVDGVSVTVDGENVHVLFNGDGATLFSGVIATVQGVADLAAVGVYNMIISNGATTAPGTFVGQPSQLAISDNVVVATYDVDASGQCELTDLLLIYQWLPFSAGGQNQAGSVPQAVSDNIASLAGSGAGDVDDSGALQLSDLLFVYQWLPFSRGGQNQAGSVPGAIADRIESVCE